MSSEERRKEVSSTLRFGTITTTAATMPLTLFIGNKRYSSWSMRPWVLLKALAIPFDENLHFFKPGAVQQDFLSFSPTAKVPCLHDTDTNPAAVVVWDSLAICEYIAEQYPRAWPSDVAARAFARSASAEMHSGFVALRNTCPMNVAVEVELGPWSEGLRRDIARLKALFEEGLDRFGGPWLAGGRFTIADAMFAPVASRCRTYGIALEGRAGEYVDRLFWHPAVQEWVCAGAEEGARYYSLTEVA